MSATDRAAMTVPFEEIASHAAEVDRDARWPVEGVEALREAGLLSLGVPAEYGGPGGGPLDIAAAVREIGAACGSTSMIYAMHAIATQTILADPGPADGPKADVLRSIARGEHLTTLAFSERGSRSHFWAQPTHATAVAGGVEITADKSWVTSAAEAQSYVVATGAPGTAQSLATELYLVEVPAAGVQIERPFDGLGMCGNGSSPVALRGLRVSSDRRIGPPAGGYDTMMRNTFPWFVTACASCCVGLSGRALDLAIAHVTTSRLEHSGERLADLAVIRARLAQAKVRHLQTAAFVDHVVAAFAAGVVDQVELLAVKAAAAEMAIEVTDAAMRACGGAAYSRQVPVERFFRDARAATVMAPTTDVLYDLIGGALTSEP